MIGNINKLDGSNGSSIPGALASFDAKVRVLPLLRAGMLAKWGTGAHLTKAPWTGVSKETFSRGEVPCGQTNFVRMLLERLRSPLFSNITGAMKGSNGAGVRAAVVAKTLLGAGAVRTRPNK